jgi:predicted amidohydrolase YtcJ
MRQEDKTGSIEVGKLADVIVLDQNIFDVPVTSVSKTKVLLTVLGGKTVYRSAAF